MLDNVLYVIKALPVVFLLVIQFAMMLRAVCSWFLADTDGPFYNFLIGVTEPLIAPVAALFETFGWFENSLFDMPFLATMMIISIVESLLAAFL